jgi:hypothetical protein
VLNRGEILDEGSPSALLAAGGLYQHDVSSFDEVDADNAL